MDTDGEELRVAQLIQQQFLPRRLPALPGWTFAAHYQPAREVGGDFYDVTALPGGLIGLAVGDVAGKGIPAALLMATTHSVLRAEAYRLISPGSVLARVNAQLVQEMPPAMFVTCFYLVLDPSNGRLRYANAGHCLPYQRTRLGVVELNARGMPLGLMPGMVLRGARHPPCARRHAADAQRRAGRGAQRRPRDVRLPTAATPGGAPWYGRDHDCEPAHRARPVHERRARRRHHPARPHPGHGTRRRRPTSGERRPATRGVRESRSEPREPTKARIRARILLGGQGRRPGCLPAELSSRRCRRWVRRLATMASVMASREAADDLEVGLAEPLHPGQCPVTHEAVQAELPGAAGGEGGSPSLSA